MSFRMQLRRIVFMMIIEYAVPSLALNYPCTEYQIICQEFTVICVHAWEKNTYARVNLYGMSTYMSCWSWSVSQFSACMTLLRHGCERNSFWNSQTDSQMSAEMYPFPDQMNWQFVQILMHSKIPFKTSCTGQRWRKAKDFFVFCWGKIFLVLFQDCCSFALRHLCPVHKINALQTSITAILATHLLHEFIVNVKPRMDWSYRKPYICLSFNFWKQYPSNGICLTSVNMQKDVASLWLLWKSPIFPDLYWNALTW